MAFFCWHWSTQFWIGNSSHSCDFDSCEWISHSKLPLRNPVYRLWSTVLLWYKCDVTNIHFILDSSILISLREGQKNRSWLSVLKNAFFHKWWSNVFLRQTLWNTWSQLSLQQIEVVPGDNLLWVNTQGDRKQIACAGTESKGVGLCTRPLS